MKLIFLCCFLLISVQSWSEAFNFKKYSALVNKAELQIVEASYTNALTYFDSAFALNQKPFVLDLFNASISAIRCGNKQAAMVYCNMLAQKGVGKDFFLNHFEYAALKKEPGWHDLLFTAGESKKRFGEATKELVDLLDRLYNKDQYAHVRWSEIGGSEEKQAMNLTDDEVSRDLFKIFSTRGFVGEEMLGAPVDERGWLAYSFPFYIIMLHNYQSRDGDTLFNTILKNAREDGLIKPEEFASIQDAGTNMGNRPYYGTSNFYVQYLCSIYLENYHAEQLAKIEQERAKIGLCTTADQLKKTVYYIENPGSSFKIYGRASQIMSFKDKKSEQYMLDNSAVIIKEVPNCKL